MNLRAVFHNKKEQNIIFNILQPQALTRYSWQPFKWIETDIKLSFSEFEWYSKSAAKSGKDIYNFILPSEEDNDLAPRENLESNSAGLKSSQTGGVLDKWRSITHCSD